MFILLYFSHKLNPMQLVTAVLGGCAEHTHGTLILRYFDDKNMQLCTGYRSLRTNAPKNTQILLIFQFMYYKKKMF